MKETAKSPNTLLDKAYIVGVAIKGFDGLVELLAGLILLFTPSLAHNVLQRILHETQYHHGLLAQWLTRYVGQLDTELAKSGLVVVIAFLLTHGIVKLVLVYCLFKEILWAYPYALVILGAFLAYQAYILVRNPTVGIAFLVVLDIAIIALVWREYRVLQAQK
jgi:uncharacterized membrane protein